MPDPDPEDERKDGSRKHPLFQWAVILTGSLVLTACFDYLALPAATLISPLLVGAVAGIAGASVRVPMWLFIAAQALVGILIADAVDLDILRTFGADWPYLLLGAFSTLAASSYLGWQISRWHVLPGSTGVLGAVPGAATAMVLMASTFGADPRLVAFMQYLRVMLVAIVAAVIAGIFSPDESVAAGAPEMSPAFDWSQFGCAILVAAAGAAAGRLLRLPTPYFLGAMLLGTSLSLVWEVDFRLPSWLLSTAYALVGWTIGLSFTRSVVRQAARALPSVVILILGLMILCAGIGFVLSKLLGIDLLTAYLATSPSGMDAVAIIAMASGNVNISFVIAMQLSRFLFVLLFGPIVARILSRKNGSRSTIED